MTASSVRPRTGDGGHGYVFLTMGKGALVIEAEPQLPLPRGPLSAALFAYLRGDAASLSVRPVRTRDGVGDEDLQLALYCCYELHYRGFESVSATREWDADVMRFRGGLERAFTQALVEAVPQPRIRDPREAGRRIEAAIDAFDGPSLSSYLLDGGTRDEFAEFLVHRSAYQLKEADPHTWAIPRYSGRSRAALIEIQADEYGSGVPGAAHSELFAATMRSMGLDATYGAYLERLPGTTLATVNLASMFGLHRRWLPALLGHLALFETTSVEPMGRYASTVDRHGLGAKAREFYDVHVLADAHHGPLALSDLVGGYLDEQPQDAATLLWGALALLHVEDRFAVSLLEAWSDDRSSLRPRVQPTISSSGDTSSPSKRSVASAMHRWYSARDWRSSWTSLR